MSELRIIVFSILLATTFPLTLAASQCIDCHTDAKRLQAIAATLPQPVASAETAGKG